MYPSNGWVLDDVEVAKLDAPPPYGFDCGRAEQNEFLYHRAWDDQRELLSSTYLFYVKGICAAYATVFVDALPLSRKERGATIRYREVGALKLGQLGVHRWFHGQGLGRHAVAYALRLALNVSRRVGCRYLTLDAHPEVVPWYEGQGFERNRLRQQLRAEEAARHARDPGALAVSMRFDLREV